MWIWNHEKVKIFAVMAVSKTPDVWIEGNALYETKIGIVPITWVAKALEHGWYVSIDVPHGRKGEFQGSTFNLPLEVATAIRRIV